VPLSQPIGIPVIALKLCRAIAEQRSKNVASKALPIPTWLVWTGEVVGVDHGCRRQSYSEFGGEPCLPGASPAIDSDQPRRSASSDRLNAMRDVLNIQASKVARESSG
jgi:hypothetical protein